MVAIQGELGSFSEGATRQLVGPDAGILSCATFDELFAAVATGRAQRGVVPVHNSIAGAVYNNGHRARTGRFAILGELRYPVRQCLIVRAPTGLAALRRVASHPVALRQCTRFFAAHPACTAVPVRDTASGVRAMMEGRLAVDAAIGSFMAAQRYGATVLLEGVDDARENYTEFLLIAPG